jgi:hypothetical protein
VLGVAAQPAPRLHDKIRGTDARARLAEAAEDWDKARAKYVAVAAPKVLDAGALSWPA